MNETDRIERLEERVARLEEMIGALAGKRGGGEAGKRSTATETRTAEAKSTPVPTRPSPLPGFPASPLPSEQWIGQRLLLAVGVVALILAAGYLLRLSFDRGWISPLMRCIGGAVAGVIVGGIGWRLHPRYRTYGAALIGCGAAIIYLSVWAAARLYSVLPPTTGILSLALVSIALAMIAFAINVEALGATAALGAFFAPLLLGHPQANADPLLLYLASMAAGLGLVAARKRWRLAMFIVALSYFCVAYVGADDRASPWAMLLYGVAGGTAGIYIGLRERWWETRFLSFAGGWTFVVAASDRLDHSVAILIAGLLLAAPVWGYALRSTQVLPVHLARAPGTAGWSLGEAIYFFLTPFLVGWAVHELAPTWLDARAGLVALIVGIPYLVAGYQRPRPVFALVAAGALGLAAWQHWDGVGRVWVLLALSLLWAGLDHRLKRSDGRWFALATLWAALDHLLSGALTHRTTVDAAFVGSWALALWGTASVAVALAAGVWRSPPGAPAAALIRGGLWALGGALVLFGVTGEISRYFELKTLSSQQAGLASGLAVSAWWLVFAAALVAVGFRRSLKQVRLAGLAVAGLAVVKVLLYDLSSLDALYRVGSVFILGLVLLLLAYLYHRQARGETRGTIT
ncbi:MAG TPA: DUF2339 domain-containing protein [Gemmatimonadales bacterium]|nr:DUF2339 domain-containing protein [Gemmatimonadales bacterium]